MGAYSVDTKFVGMVKKSHKGKAFERFLLFHQQGCYGVLLQPPAVCGDVKG